MKNLLCVNKSGYCTPRRKKNNLYAYLQLFTLFLLLLCITDFTTGCDNGFKVLLDTPLEDEIISTAVTGVSLDKTTSTTIVGGTIQLNPTIIPSNATNQNVTWSSSAAGIATVSPDGLVSGVAIGNTNISVKTADGDHTATCAVTVSAVTVAVTDVNLNATTSTINVGGTVQLTPTITPSNATNQNVTWSSNATGVATVSSSGLVTGIAAGNATITVTTVDGSYTANCAVTVSVATVPVTGVSLDKTTASIDVWGNVQLTPAIIPSNATNQNVTWSSNATGYATVSSGGLVSGVALGTATITVRTVDGNFSATCTVTVLNGIYWTESGGSIKRILTDKTGEITVVTVPGTPLDIALYKSGKMIYWTEYYSSLYYVYRAGSDGSGIATIGQYQSSAYHGPTALAINQSSGTLYWNQYQISSNSYMRYSGMDSLTPNQSFTINNPYVYGIGIDSIHSKIYFTANTYWDLGTPAGSGNNGIACYSNLDGSSLSTPVGAIGPSANSTSLRGLAVDAAGGYIYYVQNDNTPSLTIRRVNLSFQPNPGTVWITANGFGIEKPALDKNNNKIYWISKTDKSIYRADLGTANSNIEQFYTVSDTPTGITITQ